MIAQRINNFIQAVIRSIMKFFEKKKIYYDPLLEDEERNDFRDGEAWMVNPDPNNPADENFGTLKISPVTYQALFEFGVIFQLDKLPNDGWLDSYEEGILFPEGLFKAAEIFENFAERVGNQVKDSYCFTQISPERIEYRMKLQPAEVKEGFKQLADFCRSAAEKGYGVQLWL